MHVKDFSKQPVSDVVHKTTCYMCACRCGINVHMRDDKVRYIEGNRDHPVNRGVLCAKGSAGIMTQYAPSKLRKPLKRVGPRGSGEFVEIEWDEALATAAEWLGEVRGRDPRKLAFFTGRDQSQALTGWWAQQYGTPNFAAHGGFCSVNMAAAGIYTIGGSFWEFGAPDWERCKYLMIFGVAEDHDSNPIKLGIAAMKNNGGKIVSVNPVRTGYSAVADEWVGVRPGTDGLFILSMVQHLLATQQIDLDYLLRYTNVSWLVIDDPSAADHGLFARDDDGNPLVFDLATNALGNDRSASNKRQLNGSVTLADGRSATPVFQLMAGAYLDERYSPDAVAEHIGLSAADIRRMADEMAHAAFEQEITIEQQWTDLRGQQHDTITGRPVAVHAMRGISAHSNGFQTCRALHLLQLLLGSIDCPGGFRFKPPYPKAPGIHPKPAGKASQIAPNTPLPGALLGYVQGPEDLLINDDASPVRIDKAYSWDAPMSAHGMMHMVIANAFHGDPYPVDVLFMYMANMAWNSSMNTASVINMLTAKRDDGEYKIPKFIYSDAFNSETVHYADLILPDTTYLERHDCISLLDRPIGEPDLLADSIRHPVIEPDRDVRPFQSVLIDLGARLGLPGMVNDDGQPKYADYADYIVNHQRKPGVGPLAGFRGEDGTQSGRGAVNPQQLDQYIANGGFWSEHIPEEALYFKHANAAYQHWAVEKGLIDKPDGVVFQIYCEPLQKFRNAAAGRGDIQAPEAYRARIEQGFSPLPQWYEPFEGAGLDLSDYPLHAVTQRPMAMYHSWGSQNAWLRQIHGRNPLFVSAQLCDELGVVEGDWVELRSHHSAITVPVVPMHGVNRHTVWTWNAIGKRKGAWNLKQDASEGKDGFLLNHLIHELLPPKGDGLRWANSDPVTGQAAWYDLRVAIKKAPAPLSEHSLPSFPALAPLPGATEPADALRYGQPWTDLKEPIND